jgi:branched-chain amino acid transport system ATP-binding protein
MTQSILSLQNVDVFYGKSQVLWDINLSLEASEVVCLIGLNGAGKSSLLRSISNVMVHSEGTILFDGKSFKKIPPHNYVRKGIAHVPERRHIFSSLSVEENLRLSYIPKSGKTEEELLSEVYQLFPDLLPKRAQLGGTLSGGQQQMVAIGRAVMANPKLILFDEPTLGLAPIITKQTLAAIRKLSRGDRTILITEEKPSLVLEISDRGYVMEAGRITVSAGVQELTELNNQGKLLQLRKQNSGYEGAFK